MPFPAIAAGGAGLLKLLGYGSLAAGTGAAGLGYTFPSLIGQDAKSVLLKDQDRYELDPTKPGKPGKVERSAVESAFDKLFRREKEIQEEGKKQRLTQLLRDPGTKALLTINPTLRSSITADTPQTEIDNKLLLAQSQAEILPRIAATGLNTLSRAEQLQMTPDELGTYAAGLERRRKQQDQRDAFYSPDAVYARDQDRFTQGRLLDSDIRAARGQQNDLAVALAKITADKDRSMLDYRLGNQQLQIDRRRLEMEDRRADRRLQQEMILRLVDGLRQTGQAFTY